MFIITYTYVEVKRLTYGNILKYCLNPRFFYADSKVMKTVTILFAHKDSKYLLESCFGGSSALDLSLSWAQANKSEKIFVLAFDDNKSVINEKISGKAELITKQDWNTSILIQEMASCVASCQADTAVFAWAECPFLNRSLTTEILETHRQFMAEYTYAEGYPYGFAPETVDGGTLNILKELSENLQKEAGTAPVSRSAIFDFLKTDINAFEVETVLADDDYRLLRYSFECGKKENLMQCKALYESLADSEKNSLQELDVEKVSISASKNSGILKTVPGFYNIQLTSEMASNPIYLPEDAPVNKGSVMETEKALKLVDDIAAFSENAVISLSFFGDPVKHPDLVKICEKILSYEGLSVFIETDFMPEETAAALKKISENAVPGTSGLERVMIAINMDAASAGIFSKIRGTGEENFEKAFVSIGKTAELFPASTYPQFIRMNENENELESFYRYWNEKSNPSKGNLIIQKYNSYCKRLPERKPADLSPVERNVCWHLRRDMNILSNGDVTFCHCVYGNITGNVFKDSLSDIWKKNESEILNQVESKYCKNCGDCDEYYTFNF